LEYIPRAEYSNVDPLVSLLAENHSNCFIPEISSPEVDNILEFINLDHAKERDRYGSDPDLKVFLWCSGGVHATNVGIQKALSEGFEYVCHLDHDD
jgi:hypothetical protein